MIFGGGLQPGFEPAAVLVTGGAGFIGSNLVRWLLAHPAGLRVVVLDRLTYAGNVANLHPAARESGPGGDGRFFFVHGDICDVELVKDLLSGDGLEPITGRRLPLVNAILHLAAESHVDRSILGPHEFVRTNIQGTLAVLEATRSELGIRPREFRFLNVSTDEVYGSLEPEAPAFRECNPLLPNSPYSASKAGADCLVRAYHETFGLPCLTSRCSNNYGPYQYPEKLIPLMVTRALADQPLPVYGDGLNVRDWLHVTDHCTALWAVLTRGAVGRTYNIGGNCERRNIDIVRAILAALDKPEALIQYVRDRPGHDRRYAMDASLIERDLGWRPQESFDHALRETIDWYVANRGWWDLILREEHMRLQDPYA
jgi:dTDP-glucose 4,6-dehydratase